MPVTLIDILKSYLLASWINLLVYSFELALVFLYFHRFPKDKTFVRVMVISLVLADTVATISACATVWLGTITYAGVPVDYNDFWTGALSTLVSIVPVTFERSYLIYRIFSLSNSKKKIVCGLLMILVVLQVILCFYIGIRMAIQPDYMERPAPINTLSFCVAIFVDVAIPVVLIFQLRKFSSVFQSTKNIIRRISIQAMSSGSVVAVASTGYMVLFWIRIPEFLIFGGTIGRLYSLTVLVNLFGRVRQEDPDLTRDGKLSNLNFRVTAPTSREVGTIALGLEDPVLHNISCMGDSPRHSKADV